MFTMNKIILIQNNFENIIYTLLLNLRQTLLYSDILLLNVLEYGITSLILLQAYRSNGTNYNAVCPFARLKPLILHG